MKKKLIMILLCMCLGLPACASSDGTEEQGHFVVIDGTYDKNVGYITTMYAKDTKVMYALFYHGSISPLYNADGTLQIYKED